MKCIKCNEEIPCSFCYAQQSGVFVLPHECPNSHQNCAENIGPRKLIEKCIINPTTMTPEQEDKTE
jgi:hypothetical protein